MSFIVVHVNESFRELDELKFHLATQSGEFSVTGPMGSAT